MKMKKKRLLSIVLTFALLVGLLPGMSLTALAADVDPFARLVNTTVTVRFNNHDWNIIKDDSWGYDAGTLTLLAADTSFGTCAFDVTRQSNNYSTSTVKGVLDAMTASGGAFADVATAIADTEYGKLYLLSIDEANRLSEKIRSLVFTGGDCILGEWWLRSPGGNNIRAAVVYGLNGSVFEIGHSVENAEGLRPALKLNLSSVDYSSETRTFTVKQSPEPHPCYPDELIEKAIKVIAEARAYYESIKDKPEYADIAAQLESVIEVAEALVRNNSASGAVAGNGSAMEAIAGNDGTMVSAIDNAIRLLRNALEKAKADVTAIDKRITEEGQVISITECEITVRNRTYTGRAVKKPAVTVMYGEERLKEGKDYTLAYNEQATEIGAYRLKVRGMGRYTGTKAVTFKINPKGTAFTGVKAGKRRITLKWKRQKNITGYQLQYGREKDFSDGAKVAAGKDDTSATLRKPEAGKTYYVRIRTMAKVGGRAYFSAWSKAEAVNTGGVRDNAAAQAVEIEGVEDVEGLGIAGNLSLPEIGDVGDVDIVMDEGTELTME